MLKAIWYILAAASPVFIVLKLCGAIGWSWFVTLLPLILFIINTIAFLVFGIVLLLHIAVNWVDGRP